MQTLTIHSMLKPGSHTQLAINPSQPLGSGSQGTVYPVIGTNQVVKLYADQGGQQHLVAFVRHLQSHHLIDTCAGLRGLPQDVFTTDDNKVGVVMNQVSGQSLEQADYKPLGAQRLGQRLALAYSLAQGVTVLHACDIILADLAEPNIMVDLPRNQAYLIDIDGGGIGHGQNYILKPIIWGHDVGSLLALEIRNRTSLPSAPSDAWSLSVLLHRLLSQPPKADPFFFAQDHRVLASDLLWPPPPQSQPTAQHRLLALHRTSLARLGPAIRAAFQNTFSPLGRHHPEHRISAGGWLKTLAHAQRWLYTCNRCQQEIVAERVMHCPYCRAAVAHAQIKTPKQGIPLHHSALTLTERHLGLGNTYQPVLRWDRRQDQLVVQVLSGAFKVRGTLYDKVVSAGETYAFRPGEHRCQFQGANAQSVALQLTIPRGAWAAPLPLPPIRLPIGQGVV